MNPIIKTALYLVSIPARLKGMKFGKNSFIAPGYDWLGYSNLKGVFAGNNVNIGKRAWLDIVEKGKIVIGDNVNIGRDCVISSKSKIEIGEGTLFSYRVSVVDHEHDFDVKPLGHKTKETSPIKIGKNCFVGAGSMILKGVELGDDCIVGANSVVTKSFPKKSVIGGVPAKLIKKKN